MDQPITAKGALFICHFDKENIFLEVKKDFSACRLLLKD